MNERSFIPRMFANDWPARRALATPNGIAVTEPRRGVSLTWADLDRHAAGFARYLAREADVRPGDRVAVLAESRFETIVALFAVARLRAALVPLNVKLAAPELRRVFLDATPRALVASDRFLGEAHHLLSAAAAAGAPRSALVALDGVYAQAAAGPRDGVPAEAVVSERDPWLVLYTSGSTGRPKGALVTHGQVLWNAIQTLDACDLGPADSTVTYTPLFYTGAWHCLSTPLWYRGGAVHLVPEFDPAEVLGLLERAEVTTLFGVPTTLAALAAEPGFARARLERLRVLLCGGAACPDALIAAYAERGIHLRHGYGLTEVGPNCLGLRPGDAPGAPGSIGRPNRHLETRVTAEGELCLRGPTVFGGYLGNEAATAAAFDEGGFFRTGDIVRADEQGFFYLVGRKGDLFKSGGEKVYAGEVEAAIARHEAVAEVVVFGVPDPKWGEVGRAVIVPRPGMTIDPEALRLWLAHEIARFKVPKTIVVAAALPRTDTGKIARAEVRARYAPQQELASC